VHSNDRITLITSGHGASIRAPFDLPKIGLVDPVASNIYHHQNNRAIETASVRIAFAYCVDQIIRSWVDQPVTRSARDFLGGTVVRDHSCTAGHVDPVYIGDSALRVAAEQKTPAWHRLHGPSGLIWPCKVVPRADEYPQQHILAGEKFQLDSIQLSGRTDFLRCRLPRA